MKKEKVKKTRKALLFLVFFFFIAITGVFGEAFRLENLLTGSQIAALRAGDRLTETQFSGFYPKLIPNHPEFRAMVEEAKRGIDINTMVETLYLFEKPAGADTTGWTANEFAALYNQATAISTLQGIEYYSWSKGKIQTLYETSSVIDDPNARRPVSLPDPYYSMPPAEFSLYARQKDTTFGDNTYQYTYRVLPGALVIGQQNLSALTYLITAVAKNNLNSLVAVIDAGDSLVIYMVSIARTATTIFISRETIGELIKNRAAAILDWIVTGAERAFRRAY